MITQKELKALAGEFYYIRPHHKILYDHHWARACRAVTRSLNSVNQKFDLKMVNQFLELSGYNAIMVAELDASAKLQSDYYPE